MPQAYLSLGSNLGDRLGNLRAAVARIAEFASIHALSMAYESAPVGFTEQPWFINAVACVEVELTPAALLHRLLEVEREMGRRRDQGYIPKGPRIIDLDIVLFGDLIISTPELTVPHPAMHLRRFVLEPLVEIAPAAVHPLLHRTASELLADLPGDGPVVRRLEPLSASHS